MDDNLENCARSPLHLRKELGEPVLNQRLLPSSSRQHGLLDVLNKHFQNVLGITKLQFTGLQVAYFGSYFVFPHLVGGPVIRRWGYKTGIMLGLGLYVAGALFFWPAAKFLSFGGFVAATFVVMACGCETPEEEERRDENETGPTVSRHGRADNRNCWNGTAACHCCECCCE